MRHQFGYDATYACSGVGSLVEEAMQRPAVLATGGVEVALDGLADVREVGEIGCTHVVTPLCFLVQALAMAA